MTTEQLNYIKKGLKKLDLTDDLIDEIADHWACEIEEKVNNDESFEEALKAITKKWGRELFYTDSWFTNHKTFPKLMTNRLTDINKKGLKYALPVVLLYVLTYFVFDYFQINFDFIQKIIYAYLVATSIFLVIKGLQLKYKNKYSTIYSYVLTRRFSFLSHLFFCLLIYFVSDFFSSPNGPNGLNVFWVGYALFYNVMHFYFHYKQNKFQKNSIHFLEI